MRARKRPDATEERITFEGIFHENGTVTFEATVTLNTDSMKMALAVMALRGFPGGMPVDTYPTEDSCEAASPGIVEAQNRCRGALTLPCTVTVDADGNRVVELKK